MQTRPAVEEVALVLQRVQSQQEEQQQQLHNYIFVVRYYSALVVQYLSEFF